MAESSSFEHLNENAYLQSYQQEVQQPELNQQEETKQQFSMPQFDSHQAHATNAANFLRAKPPQKDIIRRREDFAISLRKKTKQLKIAEKRRRFQTKARTDDSNLQNRYGVLLFWAIFVFVYMYKTLKKNFSIKQILISSLLYIMILTEIKDLTYTHLCPIFIACHFQHIVPCDIFNMGLQILLRETQPELRLTLIVQLRRMLADTSLLTERYFRDILDFNSQTIQQMFQWIADDQFEPLHLKELMWLLINIFSFDSGDAAGDSVYMQIADDQWSIIESVSKCIGNQYLAIMNIYKDIQRSKMSLATVGDIQQAKKCQAHVIIITNCLWLIANICCTSSTMTDRVVVQYQQFKYCS